MKKIIITICLLFVASNAYAWGALEQGILWGIGGTLVTQQVIRGYQQPQTVYVQPAYPQHPDGYYYTPAPSRFTHRPMYRAVDIWIPECGCYRTVMVQIN
jgi:hypothetical protein